MVDQLPRETVWRKKKVGFEPPQKSWMQDRRLQELIHEAKRKLVSEQVLKPDVLNRPAQSSESHEPNNYDWRYLAAGSYL